MKIGIDADDAGQALKRAIFEDLVRLGVDIEDLEHARTVLGGTVDYPDIAFHLAQKVRDGSFDRGILICGTGLGMAMCACKVPGVFAGTCHDVYSAERLSKSNDAQILTMGERVIGAEAAKTVVRAWLASEFAGGPSTAKVQRMRDLEKQHPATSAGTSNL